MRLLVYSDVQATDGSERLFSDPSLPLQHWRVDRFFKVLRALYQEHGCDGLVDLGDTTDDRSAIPVPTIDVLLSSLSTFPDGEHFKLIGNHEQFLRNTRIHVGRLFASKFQVIDKREIFYDGDTALIMCSYPEDEADLTAWLEAKAEELRGTRTILFGHFQAAGSLVRNNTVLAGIPVITLDKFYLALLGHVHKPQTVGRNAHYVGSPFQQDFGEAGEDKRVAIVDTTAFTVTWLPLTGFGFPVYKTVLFDDFVEAVKKPNEDRLKVILSSPEESQLFYAHALSSRAEPLYYYDVVEDSAAAVAENDWSFEAVLARYVTQNPLKAVNIPISEPEMLQIGIQIAETQS